MAKILLVDDEPSILNVLSTLMKGEGHEVVPKGRSMTDAPILAMNFLVSGVHGKIAK